MADTKYKSPGLLWNQLKNTSSSFVTADIDKLSDVDATAAELNTTDNIAASITFAYAAGGADVSEVTMTVVNAAGEAIAAPFSTEWWLSDAATGLALTGTAASGTVQAKSSSGEDRNVITAKKHTAVQTLASGIYIIEITASAKTAYYPCAIVPGTGATAVGAQMASGDYGT
jgi:hypothetical protein